MPDSLDVLLKGSTSPQGEVKLHLLRVLGDNPLANQHFLLRSELSPGSLRSAALTTFDGLFLRGLLCMLEPLVDGRACNPKSSADIGHAKPFAAHNKATFAKDFELVRAVAAGIDCFHTLIRANSLLFINLINHYSKAFFDIA